MADFIQSLRGNVAIAYDNATNDGYYYSTVSRPQGPHWLAAAATISPRSPRDATVTPSNDLDEGEGQSTVVALGQLVVNNSLLQATGKDFTAMKNHTVMVSSVMFAVGVLGNVLALCVLATSGGDHRKSLFYTLVAGLAVSDLLGTCSTSPVVIAVYLNDFQWVGGQATCHYFSFAMIFAGFATMLIVCAMSVERYVCVRHPYTYHTRLSGTSLARLTLLGCWALSLTIAALPLLGLGRNVRQYPLTWCFFDFNSRRPSDMAFNYIYAIIALVCVVVTFVCNVSVIYALVTLRSRQSRLDASESRREGAGGRDGGKGKEGSKGGANGRGGGGGGGGGYRGKRRTRRATSQRFGEVQMMIMLIGVTVIFTFCFAPLMIFVLVCQTGLQFDSRRWVLTLIRVASFNPILDPWVYILCRRELVWRAVRLFRWALRLDTPTTQQVNASLLTKDPAGGGVMNGNGNGLQGGGVKNGGVATRGAEPNGEGGGGGGGGEKALSKWEDPYNPSCLAFCYQCLCLPPAPRTPASMASLRQSGTASFRSPSPRHAAPGGGPRHSLVTQPTSPGDRLLLLKLASSQDVRGSCRSLDSNL